MTEQIGLWRATYSPGEWVVLGGPTSLVVLQPAPAQSSPIVERLWRVVLKADSLDDLIAELALHNVSKMPDFAAFFWRDNAMRSLIRGELEIVDLDSGRVIAGANEMVTWSEVDLGHVRRVRVNCESGGRAADRLVLPLVVGAVTASFVELDATPRALVSSPQPLGSAPTQTETNQQHEDVDPFGAIERSADQSPAPVSPVPGLAPVAELEPARSAVVDAVVVDDHSVGAPEVEGDDAADSDLLAAVPGTSPGLSDQSEAADESELAGSAADRAEADAAVADSAEAAAEPPAALDPFGRTEVYHAFGPDGEDVEESEAQPEVPGFEAHPGFEAKPGAQSEPVIESEPAFALDADTEAEPEASPFGRPAAAEPDASPFGRPLSAEQPPLAEQPGQDERSAVDGDDQPAAGDQGASAEQPSADERPAPASSDPHNPFSLAAVQDNEDASPSPSTPFGASAPAPAGPSAPFGASAGSAAGVASAGSAPDAASAASAPDAPAAPNQFAPPPPAPGGPGFASPPAPTGPGFGAPTPPAPAGPGFGAPTPAYGSGHPMPQQPAPQQGSPFQRAPLQAVPQAPAAGMSQPPAEQELGEGAVLGLLCEHGHANPPDAARCRRCGGQLQGQARIMQRPVMAVLRVTDGQEVEIDRSVLIGRSPQASKVSRDELPKLLTVVSPSTDISRTHLQVSPDGWEVVAIDLHSTNGTLLIRPGQPEPEPLTPGEAVRIFPGCVLDLGDGVSIHVDHPA